jgi:hypothetical protein
MGAHAPEPASELAFICNPAAKPDIPVRPYGDETIPAPTREPVKGYFRAEVAVFN